MWLISARDLQYRARRFLIAIAVTALVLGLALVFDGVKRSVRSQTVDIVRLFGADRWAVAHGASGPFTTSQVLPTSVASQLRELPGIRRADPVVISRGVVDIDKEIDINVVGHRPSGAGAPPLVDGRSIRGPGEVVVGDGVNAELGDQVAIAGQDFRVVGHAAGARFYFGYPTVFVSLRDAQRFAFKGQSFANAIVVRGLPREVPSGLTMLSNQAVIDDLDRPLEGGIQTIEFTDLLLWIVAAGIVGSIVYLSALERVRDFAVYKATGAANGVVAGGLLAQAVFVTLLSALIAVAVAHLVALGLPFPAEINVAAISQLAVIALIVGLAASLAGLRRALSADPALAFGGA